MPRSFVYVRGVRDGDTVLVGAVDAAAPVLPIGNPWTIGSSGEAQRTEDGFRMLRLPSESAGGAGLRVLPWDWNDTGSFAGLWAGTHHAWGVPYYVEPASSAGRPMALEGPVTLRLPPKHAGTVYLFFAPHGSESTLSVEAAPRKDRLIRLETCALGWSSWPPCFQQKILVAECPVAGVGSITIRPREMPLWWRRPC